MPLSNYGYFIAGMILMLIGATIMSFEFRVPFIGIRLFLIMLLIDMIGWTLVMIGALMIMYGVLPETATWVAFIVAAIVYIAGGIAMVRRILTKGRSAEQT